jgi:hypothetical protein
MISPDLEKVMVCTETPDKSLVVFLDLDLKLKYQGDSYNGPGNA